MKWPMIGPDKACFAMEFVVNNFALMARIQGEFTTEQLNHVLERVSQRYLPAAARAVFEGHQGWFTTEGVPAIRAREIKNCNEQDWEKEACFELTKPFSTRLGPQVRAVLLRGAQYSDLLLTFNHGNVDGMAGVYFLRDTLYLLGNPHGQIESLPPPPRLAELVPAEVRNNTRVKFQINIVRFFFFLYMGIRRLLNWVRPKQPPDLSLIPSLRPVSLIAWEWDKEKTDALVARSKQEKTSVQGAICAAWMRAQADVASDENRWQRKVSSPVNLRSALGDAVGEAFGSYNTSITTAADCNPDIDFWDVARNVRQQLLAETSNPPKIKWTLFNAAIVDLMRVEEIQAMSSGSSSGPVDYDFSITNLGRLQIPVAQGDLRIKTVRGTLVNSAEQERTVGVNTFDERLHFSFLFREHYLPRKEAEYLVERAMFHLSEAFGK